MTRPRWTLSVVVVAVVMAVPGAAMLQALAKTEPAVVDAAAADPVIAAVGDMVCHRGHKEGPIRPDKYGECRYTKVSDIVANGDYDAFLALGDLQYLQGDYDRFMKYYDPSYGRVKNITQPVPGNHEHYTPGAAGYFRYFGARAHPPKGYYSYDLGEWHMVALDSQLCKNKTWYPDKGYVHDLPGWGCRPGDPQYEWLKKDLAENADAECTLAYMHHPMFKWSYWAIRKTDRIQKPLLKLLYEYGADVVLTGHWHNYQRFDTMNPEGEVDPMGAAEFIVGTGGDTYGPLPKREQPTGLLEVHDGSYGVLEMTLHPDSYDWDFISAEGEPPYSDPGSAECHGAP